MRRTRFSDLAALAGTLATGAGLVWMALAIPQLVARPEFATAALGAAAGIGAILWSRWGGGGTTAAATRRDQRSANALSAQVETLEAQVCALHGQLREAAATDELTGVLNRRAFLLRLEEVSRRDARLERSLALLLVDVEGFRAINAEWGRVAGDDVLRRLAHALKSVTRGTDSVGRMEGDEFAVLLGECEDPKPVVNRLFLALMAGDERARQGDAPLRVSVGSVLATGLSEGLDVKRLFQLAGEALNSVRGSKANRSGSRVLDCSSAAAPPIQANLPEGEIWRGSGREPIRPGAESRR